MHIPFVVSAKDLEEYIEQTGFHRDNRDKGTRAGNDIVLQHVLYFQRPLVKVVILLDESAPEQHNCTGKQ